LTIQKAKYLCQKHKIPSFNAKSKAGVTYASPELMQIIEAFNNQPIKQLAGD
jgi:hypothetical protein